jgi:acyl-CoA reductase-like NAD-dependent aldehyde dehydrogenase
MDRIVAELLDISQTPAALKARADAVLERARWASEVYRQYDRTQVQQVVDAVAKAAYEKAGDYAQAAVEETGFGVVAHKKLKNEQSSIPLVDHYRDHDFVSPRIDYDRKIIEIPRPAGVVFALAPSTNPISTVYFKVLSALMTRNAIVFSPHPAARKCCTAACRYLASAAESAGAPEAVIQVIENPNIPLIDQFMRSENTDVILATGGTAMVRAAYSSANPAIGVGPGNAPVLVDPTADLKQAARHIVESKSFDNSILCTNESTLISFGDIGKSLRRELERAGAHVCSGEEVERLRRYLFHDRGFNIEAVGRDATWLAEQVGIRVPSKTRILVTPIRMIGVDEPLSREKLTPVLAWFEARSRAQAISQARALLRLSGAGHSAAVHSNDPQLVLDYAASVECYRIVVNTNCSLGAAGFGTNLAPTYTVGTGYFGRSSVGENIGPIHLVHWTKIAYDAAAIQDMSEFVRTRLTLSGPLPPAPADGVPGMAAPPPLSGLRPVGPDERDALREEIRRIIAEELRAALKD